MFRSPLARYHALMITEDQSATIAFLASPESFADGTTEVRRVQTHISEVFIGKSRVFKLKRAVRFPYLDFSVAELRRRYCEAEVAMNRRTAADLYVGVHAITQNDAGELALDGVGVAVDWVVEMLRFDEDQLLDQLAQRGELDRNLMERLADNIATFHAYADARPDGGGRTGIALTLEGNARTFNETAGGILSDEQIQHLTNKSWRALDDISELLESRRQGGCVRFCHGDMHLRNIVLLDGEPTLFDAIEFNDGFSAIDVLYDVAFLLMDLDHRGLGSLASVTLNRYLDITGASWGLSTLPLFLSVRAAVRSHVACSLAVSTSNVNEVDRLADEAREYFNRALAYLEPPPPKLVAVGGLSGSGKSRTARELAPHVGAGPGARVVRSDVLRKRIAGAHPLDRLNDDSYTPEMSLRTYQAVYNEARNVLSTGHSVIADCVFSRPEERAAIADVARDMNVPFDGLWLEAPPDVMQARVAARINNPSDADATVVRQQMDYDLGSMGNWITINSGGSRSETDALVLSALHLNSD